MNHIFTKKLMNIMIKKTIERLLSIIRYLFFEVLSPRFNAAAFKNIMDYIYVILEKFVYSFEILSQNYLKLYEETVEKEIKMANIQKYEKILVIGCGALPATTALIGLKTKAEITAIDYDAIAVKKAKKFIEKQRLSKKIKIEHADGHTYPLDNFDVIFILYGVKKQELLLENILEKIKIKTKIIFRTNQDALDQLVGGEEFLSKIFNVKDIIESESMYTSISYLLTKK